MYKTQYNAVLFKANPIITPRIRCQQTIENLKHTFVYTMQTVKIVLPVYLRATFDTS